VNQRRLRYIYIVKIRPPVFAVGDDKKKTEGNGRYTQSQVVCTLAIWGADHFGPISMKIGRVVGDL